MLVIALIGGSSDRRVLEPGATSGRRSRRRRPIRRAVRLFRKSYELLRFDQTFAPTLRMIEPEWSLSMVIFFKRLIKDASGVTAIEYGLISALIVIGALTAIQTTGLNLNLNGTFGRLASSL